jgi:hypothetical protein
MIEHFGGHCKGLSSWFPPEEEIIEKVDPKKSQIMFVDVGGGSGRDVNALKTKVPSCGREVH